MMTSEMFETDEYEWAFRKLLHLSRTEGRGYKHQLPAPCRETS